MAASGPVIASVGIAHRRLVDVAARALELRAEHVHGGGVESAVRRGDVSLVITDSFASGWRAGPPLLALVRGGVRDRIAALAAGAAEVVGIPVDIEDLVVRMAAAIGRSTGSYPSTSPTVALGPVHLDLTRGGLRLNGLDLRLSPLEERILLVLAANDGEVADRTHILEAVWGPGLQPSSNLIDRHVRDLRRKLADDWRRPSYIVTVRGQGYSLRRDTSARLD